MTRARELAKVSTAYETGGAFGHRNKIINGCMRFDQRNSGSSITITQSAFLFAVDRFLNFNNSGVNYTAQQVTDAPDGFSHSLKYTFGSAISLTSKNEATVGHIIEGVNVSDFGWGTASAKTITVSKWVKASFTGTFSIGFCNSAGTRAYATTYTVNQANTWEYKTFVIPGDTSGTWLKDNGTGLYIRWHLAAGTNFQVSSNNTWATRSGSYNAADGIYGTKAVGSATSISAGSTWQITGVQLEAGRVATPFEMRQYGAELALCQRYYSEMTFYHGIFASGAEMFVVIDLPTQMRSSPSVGITVVGGVSNAYNAYINDGKQFSQWLGWTTPGYTNRLIKLNAEL